jgi:hypothetical protein
MTFVQAINSCFRNYATVATRAIRSEFWYRYLFCRHLEAAHFTCADSKYRAIVPPQADEVIEQTRLHSAGSALPLKSKMSPRRS